jgi:hypothetical protein
MVPMRLGFSILLAALAMFVAARIGLAEPLRVSSLEARANGAARALQEAQRKERKTRDQQALLANRIASLKRDRSATDDALLERLLRESIEADNALAAQIEETQRSQQAALQALRDAFETIDARLEQIKPNIGLDKPMPVRRAAAAEISELRAVRKRMVQLLTSVKGKERHSDWADHVVTIDPLDGPSELADKDAVLALTRKKIEEKKRQLAVLIREKKIAQAARDFATDVTALDDDIRTGRVSRRPGGGGDEAATLSDSNRAPPAAAPNNESAEVGAGFRGTPEQADDFAAPPLDPSRDAALDQGQSQVGVSTPKAAVQVTPPAAVTPLPVPKQIDPNFLFNLPIEQLDADTYDLATLERYIAELEGMQKALAIQAQKIKRRSQQIEKDEARANPK